MVDLREFFSAGWNMASNRKYSSLIPFVSLSVGSIRLHSIPFGAARPGPTGLGFQPEMASVRLSSVSRSVKKTQRKLSITKNIPEEVEKTLLLISG